MFDVANRNSNTIYTYIIKAHDVIGHEIDHVTGCCLPQSCIAQLQ